MQPDNSEIKQILARQNQILEDNNRILHQLHRYEMVSFWIKVIWYVLLIGLPFALYYYVMEPYFTALGSSYDTFNAGIQEIPGIKQFEEIYRDYYQPKSEAN